MSSRPLPTPEHQCNFFPSKEEIPGFWQGHSEVCGCVNPSALSCLRMVLHQIDVPGHLFLQAWFSLLIPDPASLWHKEPSASKEERYLYCRYCILRSIIGNWGSWVPHKVSDPSASLLKTFLPAFPSNRGSTECLHSTPSTHTLSLRVRG